MIHQWIRVKSVNNKTKQTFNISKKEIFTYLIYWSPFRYTLIVTDWTPICLQSSIHFWHWRCWKHSSVILVLMNRYVWTSMMWISCFTTSQMFWSVTVGAHFRTVSCSRNQLDMIRTLWFDVFTMMEVVVRRLWSLRDDMVSNDTPIGCDI